MNKVSLAINAILVIAVIGLYVMQFSGDNTTLAQEKKIISESKEIIDTTNLVSPQPIEEEINLLEEPTSEPNEEFLTINENAVTEKVAFLDFDRVNGEWSYFKREASRIEKSHQKDVSALETRKQTLKAEYTNYVANVQNGGIQDPAKEEFLMKEEALIGQVEQRLMQSAQTQVLKANSDGMVKVKKILKKYAERNQIKYIIATGLNIASPVLYNVPTLDITSEILITLNKTYK